MSTDTIGNITINTSVELTRTCCGVCGIQFAMPTDYDQRQRRLGPKGQFHCPNGHSLAYMGKTEADLLREDLDQTRDSLAWVRQELAQTEAQRRAQKGLVTRLKNRAKAGMCPHCRRTFQNYARHMEKQHGDESA